MSDQRTGWLSLHDLCVLLLQLRFKLSLHDNYSLSLMYDETLHSSLVETLSTIMWSRALHSGAPGGHSQSEIYSHCRCGRIGQGNRINKRLKTIFRWNYWVISSAERKLATVLVYRKGWEWREKDPLSFPLWRLYIMAARGVGPM